MTELGYLQEALEAAQLSGQWKSLAELAPYLPAQLLQKALAVVRESKDKRLPTLTLAELALRLSSPQREQILWEVLVRVGEISHYGVWMLVPHHEVLPHPVLARMWLEEYQGVNLLHLLARRTRKDLLDILPALASIIFALDGEKAVA